MSEALASVARLPTVAPNVEWTFDSVVLRTTYRQCVCGTRHTCPELFESWTAPARCAGHAAIATKLIPIDKPNIPNDVPITQTTRILPLATCPNCVAARVSQVRERPPIDEAAWRRAQRRDAEERASTKAAAKPSPEGPTLDQLSKLFL